MATRCQSLRLAGGAAIGAASIALGIKALPDEKTGTEGDPPSLAYGKETCQWCRMIIGQARFASAWRQPDPGERHFDDIGCMVSYLNRDGVPSGTRFYVHDYQSETWLDASAANFLLSSELRGPMVWHCNIPDAAETAGGKPLFGFGVAAFSTSASADNVASELDEVHRFDWAGLVENLEPRT